MNEGEGCRKEGEGGREGQQKGGEEGKRDGGKKEGSEGDEGVEKECCKEPTLSNWLKLKCPK